MKKIDLRWFGECSPKHRRYSLMFAEHSVTIADCSLIWSVIYRWYFCDALVNISEALAMHPRGISGNGVGEGGAGKRGGGRVDLYKFLSWFMSVIFLYYFTCMFLSRVYVHFYCLLLFVQCTELMGYYTINIFLLLSSSLLLLKAKIFALGEWYSCRRLAFVSNSGISTLGFNSSSRSSIYHCAKKSLSTR